MMFILFILLFINNCLSSDWKCTMNINENKLFLFTNDHIYEQCTLTIEYRSSQQEKLVCTAHTLSITSLPSSSNYTMQTFKINSCQLLTLSQLPFSLPSSLENLDLSYNLLSTFILSFPLPSNLKYLRLDHNPNLIDIKFGNNLVQQRLIGVSLRHNKHIQLASLPSNLTQLDLTDCNLLQSPILTLLKSLPKLTHLSLAENQLERLPVLDERIRLKYLNVSNNRLIFLEDRWLHRQLQILDLQFNQIRSLEFLKNRLKMTSNMNQTSRQDQTTINHVLRLSLHGNPLICDCWLGAVLESSSINITDLHKLPCNSHLAMKNLLCPYSQYCASDCSCCDFEACDCHSVCPSECLCSHDAQWSRHVVKCRQGNLSHIHILLPETVTELNYQGNHIEQIKPFVFVGKILLVKLNLAQNNLRDLTNETFCAASNLRELNLSQNPSLRTIPSNMNELFGCLKHLQYVILSKEQMNKEEQISYGWTIDLNNDNSNIIRLMRETQEQFFAPSSNSSTLHPPTLSPVTLFSVYQQESITSPSIIQHNQTLIIIVFFLLLFVLLFLILLITLAICRRKLRHHLTAELERQRAQHYYYHTSLHQPSTKISESNGTVGANDSLYEQLPSLSSDSEQPFLYNEKKLNSTNAPALPPYPPIFRQHLCCHPTNSHEYQYATNPLPSNSPPQQHQCGSVVVWANQLLYSDHRDCKLRSCSSELQPCLLSNQQEQTTENNIMHYCNNETIFVPSTVCRCRGQIQNRDTYIYPHVHR